MYTGKYSSLHSNFHIKFSFSNCYHKLTTKTDAKISHEGQYGIFFNEWNVWTIFTCVVLPAIICNTSSIHIYQKFGGLGLFQKHYNDVMMGSMASQITSLTIVYSAVYSDADPRKHQNSASLSFVRGIHRGPVNSPHKGPVMRKMFPFDDVIMNKPTQIYNWPTKTNLKRYHRVFPVRITWTNS